MAQVISFINYKGGVGKTTMAVEIAATLASKHQFKVLIVDLDPQTNASFYLMPGENPEEPWQKWVDSNGSLKSVLDAAIREEPCDVSRSIMPDLHGCLDLLPSHLDLLTVDLEIAAKWGVQSPESRVIIKRYLEPVIAEKGYDFVVIDCPPNLNLVTQNALMMSDSYVVVCLPEYLSVRGIALIETRIENMMTQINDHIGRFGVQPLPGPILRGIIFNRVRLRVIDQQNWMAQVRTLYPDVTFDKVVRETVQMAEASYRGPITFSGASPARPYVQEFLDIAEEFFDKIVPVGA